MQCRGASPSRKRTELQAIATVLSLVNPAICGALFQKIEAGRSSKTQLRDATKAATAVFVILAVAALVGARVLQMFGISLDAFSVAGGTVWGFRNQVVHDERSVAPIPHARSLMQERR